MLSIRTGRASNYIVRTASANLDAPQAQWTDRAGQALAPAVRQRLARRPVRRPDSAGQVVLQPVVPARPASERPSEFAQHRRARPADGRHLAPTRRIACCRSSAGCACRTTVGAVPNNRYNDQALVLGSMDFTPPTSTTRSGVQRHVQRKLESVHGGDDVAHRAAGAQRRSRVVERRAAGPSHELLRLRHSQRDVARRERQQQLRHAVSRRAERNGARRVDVRRRSTPSVQTVSFGGNPFINTSVTQVSAQLMNALSWFSENNKHRIKFTTRAAPRLVRAGPDDQPLRQLLLQLARRSRRRHRRRRSRGSSRRASGARASTSARCRSAIRTGRTATCRSSTACASTATASCRSRCSTPNVEQLFGIANDQVPNRFYLSPRVGFSWTYGQASEIPGFDGAFRGPRAVVRGGIGVFQSTPNVAAIGSAMDNTGLAERRAAARVRRRRGADRRTGRRT